MKRLIHRLLSLVAMSPLFFVAGCATSARHASADAAAGFEFALIGDMPYDHEQEVRKFPNLVRALNAEPRLAFIVHDGDFKSGSSPCTDELFARRREQFALFGHPFIYIPGDNEWSDCGSVKGDPRDPMERLGRLRELFAAGEESLGQRRIRLERQSSQPEFSAYRENVRWIMGGVAFCGLNVPGADNHREHPEFRERNAANLRWLTDTFAIAQSRGLRGVMIVMQANPNYDLPSTNRLRLGFNELLAVLERETIAFGKPVVLVHGDSHYFRIDQPMIGQRSRRRVENFTRVETFGNPDVHWIRCRVSAADPNVFSFRPEYVRENFVNHGEPLPAGVSPSEQMLKRK